LTVARIKQRLFDNIGPNLRDDTAPSPSLDRHPSDIR
jgi:hypothetical protein